MQNPSPTERQRGYFAVGAEGISKAMNLGTLVRTAHAFGASFVFMVDAAYSANAAKSDTSRAEVQLPIFSYADAAALELPRNCRLIGVELVEDAIALPSFRHPTAAAYVLGPERGRLSPAMQARCDHIVQIPTRFCVNLGVAAAIVMYDRMLSMGRFAERPVAAGGPKLPPPTHVHGGPKVRRKAGPDA
ncbi:MAG: RNA methyltransferase [Geminicoccaceae bacterium]|nr:MAG: RNA methyltransferase [Geminicoccaceae bacterium]